MSFNSASWGASVHPAPQFACGIILTLIAFGIPSLNVHNFYVVSLAVVLNVQNLSTELETVSNWYILGFKLGLPKHDLDMIECDHQRNDRRRVEMLDLWLQHTPNATWNDVIRALEQMGENRVAKNIRQICGEGKICM